MECRWASMALCIIALLLTGCGGPNNLIRPGATAEQMQHDEAQCRAQVQQAYLRSNAPRVSAADPLADVIALKMFGGADIAGCLKARGFVEAKATATSPLFDAIKRDDAADVRSLLEKGADPNAQFDVSAGNTSITGTTMLMAASVDHTAVVQALLGKGARVNVKASNGMTAVMIAAAANNPGVVEALIRAGAEVNATRNDGASALSLTKDPNVMALLSQAGARR